MKDYKKLFEKQKQDNILIVGENVKLIEINNQMIEDYKEANQTIIDLQKKVKQLKQNCNSWEQLYNKQQGQSTAFQVVIDKLLKNF